jgi:hypothetical protein
MDNLERYDELSAKLLKIGEALIFEGNEKSDFNISTVGNIMLFLSSVIYNDDDILLFSELCGMVAAKNIVEDNELMGLLSDLSINELEALINLVKNRNK